MSELAYKAGGFFGLVFTIVLVTLANVLPWRESFQNSGGSGSTGGVWIRPDTDAGSWTPRLLPESLQNADQRDEELIAHIRDTWILRPGTGAHNLTNKIKKDYSQYGQSLFLDNYLKNKSKGFYVECGAFDGQELSDTLYFELVRNWQGLLIEPNPNIFNKLIELNRHVYSLNACLSPTTTPMVLNFTLTGASSSVTGLHIRKQPGGATSVLIQCLPLYSILAALGNRHVDLITMDIEGSEFSVLQTLPLEEIDVDMFMVEAYLAHKNEKTNKGLLIEALMSKHGYQTIEVPFEGDIVLSKL